MALTPQRRAEYLVKLSSLKRLTVPNMWTRAGVTGSRVAQLYLEAVPRLNEICVGFYWQNGASIYTPVRKTGIDGRPQVVDVELVNTYTIPEHPLRWLRADYEDIEIETMGAWPELSVALNEARLVCIKAGALQLDDLVRRPRNYHWDRLRNDYTRFWDVEWYVNRIKKFG